MPQPFDDRLSRFLRPSNTTYLPRTASREALNTLPPGLRASGSSRGRLSPLRTRPATYHEQFAPCSGPMVPTTRYKPASFRPVIGVAELFQLAPSQNAVIKGKTGDELFPSSTKAMGYWSSHNVHAARSLHTRSLESEPSTRTLHAAQCTA